VASILIPEMTESSVMCHQHNRVQDREDLMVGSGHWSIPEAGVVSGLHWALGDCMQSSREWTNISNGGRRARSVSSPQKPLILFSMILETEFRWPRCYNRGQEALCDRAFPQMSCPLPPQMSRETDPLWENLCHLPFLFLLFILFLVSRPKVSILAVKIIIYNCINICNPIERVL
jgi:hypothetical protein